MSMYPRMLYKTGGSEEIHGGKFSTLIVGDEDEQVSALADGWHLTTDAARMAGQEAVKGHGVIPDDDAPPTRDELEAKAAELGIKYDGRIGDKKLAALIAEKLAG